VNDPSVEHHGEAGVGDGSALASAAAIAGKLIACIKKGDTQPAGCVSPVGLQVARERSSQQLDGLSRVVGRETRAVVEGRIGRWSVPHHYRPVPAGVPADVPTDEFGTQCDCGQDDDD